MRRVRSAYTISISARCPSTSAIDQRSAEGFQRNRSSGKSRSIVSSRIGVFSRSDRAGWMVRVTPGSVVRATPCCMGTSQANDASYSKRSQKVELAHNEYTYGGAAWHGKNRGNDG